MQEPIPIKNPTKSKIMFALTAFVLVICTVSIAQRPDDYQIEFATHANMSCQPYETRCALGCCPFPDATCCIDGFECCRSGQICIPIIGVCIGVVNSENKELSLESNKSTRVRNLVTTCPSGTTECGEDRCCSYPDATCCSDGIHCCPYGYGCDIRNAFCIRRSSNIISMLYKTIYTPAAKVIKKLSYKSCPANDKMCPMDSNCCITDNGQWDCCPNPTSLNGKKYEQGSFCHSYETSCRFGCCPIPNGVCCSDGLQCCRQGETCVPNAGVCLVPSKDSNVLASSEATPVTLPATADKAAVPCPPCTTTCGEEKCCPVRDGTCCTDGLHCCPYHYDCDIPHERCYRNDLNEVNNNMDGSNHTAVTKLYRALDKFPYEECPGSDLLYCPSYTRCCSDNNNQWSCCLKKLPIEVEEGIC